MSDEMQGYEIKFNVYAASQAEADAASRAIKDFIGQNARQGIAVTAERLTTAVKKWGSNPLVKNYFKR